MKRFYSKFLVFLISTVFLIGCEDSLIYFTEPQPSNTKNLEQFPNVLIGQYYNNSNHSTLNIKANLIQRIIEVEGKSAIKDLDSNERLIGNSIFNIKTKEWVPIKIAGDTIVGNLKIIDTTFKIGASNILRKFMGYYFLNIRNDDVGWEVMRLKFSNKVLYLDKITQEDNFENLNELKKDLKDSTDIRKFSSTKSNFSKFLKNSSFGERDTFLKN